MVFKLKILSKLKTYPTLLTKGLIYLTLIWSVFLFSGYVDSEFLSLPTSTNTELIEEKKVTASIFTFQKNINQSQILSSPLLFINAFKATLITFNQLQYIKLITAIKKVKLYAVSLIRLPIKIISSDTKDALPLIVLS